MTFFSIYLFRLFLNNFANVKTYNHFKKLIQIYFK
ncbi:hypothetical protein ZPR_2869 [Zunongwangia profunda SM-A87]|uniref:Uncharacterized protein n=1 Tax=Zunongwangia profunda (strain DSM 18752 / CCTCC AB 206139 / SM-A87) TaxID=655815 RepID=D5BGK9_ZUNPS|nr:hypothetical protein ZPR_2869 [Zunongwangia profunda SM-A87]